MAPRLARAAPRADRIPAPVPTLSTSRRSTPNADDPVLVGMHFAQDLLERPRRGMKVCGHPSVSTAIAGLRQRPSAPGAAGQSRLRRSYAQHCRADDAPNRLRVGSCAHRAAGTPCAAAHRKRPWEGRTSDFKPATMAPRWPQIIRPSMRCSSGRAQSPEADGGLGRADETDGQPATGAWPRPAPRPAVLIAAAVGIRGSGLRKRLYRAGNK